MKLKLRLSRRKEKMKNTCNYIFSGHQPNFLPYMGYFYKMFKSDVFVLDDDVQYSNSAWHNTNFIKANGQKLRITIPVSYKYGDLINEVKICYARNWTDKLLMTYRMNYGKSNYFNEGYKLLEKHLSIKHELLSELNIVLIKDIANKFGIKCKIVIASKDVPTPLKNHNRNVYQCLKLGGNIYYSGTGGAAYNDVEDYAMNGIKLIYSDYSPIKYKQVGYPFISDLSVIDYISNHGYNLPDDWRAV